jgi:hypothetical protein
MAAVLTLRCIDRAARMGGAWIAHGSRMHDVIIAGFLWRRARVHH